MTCGSHLPHTPLYKKYKRMLARCNYKKSRYYGSRGITVCQDWVASFEVFEEWANNNGYTDELTIDRIDNNGNYEPSNCRWATILEQANNRRNNVFLDFNGDRHTEADWARIVGIPILSIRKRLRSGWSIARTLTEPVNKKKITRGRYFEQSKTK